jgi:hypothetical protein
MDVVLLGDLKNRLAFFGYDVSTIDLEIDHEKTCLPEKSDALVVRRQTIAAEFSQTLMCFSPLRKELG